MAVSAFQAFPYKDVKELLPPESQARKNLNEWEQSLNTQGKSTKRPIVFLVIGIITLLGGLFLTLAAHQILPHGINVFSNLGSQLTGYGLIVVGVVIAIVSAVLLYRSQKQKADSANYYEIASFEMLTYFATKLTKNQLFAVQDPYGKNISICYRELDEDDNITYPKVGRFSYKNDAESAFHDWAKQNKLEGEKTFISLEQLKERKAVTKKQSPFINNSSIKSELDSDSMQGVYELHNFLFSTLINTENLQEIQPLGNLLTSINDFLNVFNKKYHLHLQAIGSNHSSKKQDRWQTIKIIDRSINKEGEQSVFLNNFNNFLYDRFGIISNGGDKGEIVKGKKKQAPVCFIQEGGTLMHPQILITLIDIRRILGITSEERYFQELNNAYIW